MSFILDALKKAEAERQRQSGPTLLELRVTAPRRRWPTWSVLIGILLVANIIVVLGTALRPRPAAHAAGAPAVAASPIAAAVAPVASAVPTVATTPPAAAVPAAQPAAVQSAAAIPGSGERDASEDSAAPSPRAAAANPADEEPALPATTALPTSESEAELPSSSELGGTVPALRLDLHVYAERPADRYALINMHKAREGDMLPEGARVVAIDRDGVELSYRGTQFMLRPQ
jgi:general secretion pathway protein B